MTDEKRKSIGARIALALKGETTPGIDPDVVRDLAKLLEETGLSEIEVERGGVRVRVARNTRPAAAEAPPPSAVQLPASPQALAPQPQAPASKPSAEITQTLSQKGTLVTSPMVGTVYLSPQPGAPPFVKVGDLVEDGTLCIIEAMKTMNPVASPAAGRIAEIYVRDGQPVEFGESLMLIA